MKHFFTFFTAMFLAVTLLSQPSPKREFRGAWLHIVGNQEMKTMSEQQIKDWFTSTLDVLQKTGCNAVLFQVRPQADAFYPSSLEPWTRFLTGEQGRAPEPFWDPLQFMIDQCHSRGMELHAWLNPYRVTSNDKEELCKDHLYFKKPYLFKKYGKQLYFDPGEPESRQHTVAVITDIVNRYDLDGIHFDDYFYPYPEKFEEFHDDASFVKYAAAQGFEYWQKNDWRRYNVEILMKEINEAIKAIKPWMRFGISPFGIHRNKKDTPDGSGSDTDGLSNYEELFADVPAWAQKGYIDYIVPQLYWEIGHPRADYDALIHWWSAQNYPGQLYIGQSISTFSAPDLDNPENTQMQRKMELARTLPSVDGNVWWPGWSMSRRSPRRVRPGEPEPKPFSFTDSLINVYQSHPALIPAYTELDNTAPEGVVNLRKSGKKIFWNTVETPDPMQKAHFYVVYKFGVGETVSIDNDSNVEAIVYGKEYIPKEKKTGKTKFVVTVVDRCWNESSPSRTLVW